MKIDMEDAYFLLLSLHSKFLRFESEELLYGYTVLPFGLSLSSRVFVKCSQAALAPLRQQGIRIASYITDRLLSVAAVPEVRARRSVVVSHLLALGFTQLGRVRVHPVPLHQFHRH